MNLQTFLEEFKGSLKNVRNQYTEVFVNPSMKEMDQVGQSTSKARSIYRSSGFGNHLRFIATSNKKLYVFQPHTLHQEIVKKFNLASFPDTFEGIAEKQGNIWKLVEAHDIERAIENINQGGSIKIVKNNISIDWNWVNKWIQINPFWNNTLKNLGKQYGFKALTKKLIKEEFKDSLKHPFEKNSTIEIFTNPTNKEILDVAREIGGKKYFRFIANAKTKKIYVFTPSIVHRFINEYLLGSKGETNPKEHELWGVAQKAGREWKVVTSDMLEYTKGSKAEVLKQDWEWLKKWVDLSPLLEKIEQGVMTYGSNLAPSKFEKGKKKK